jgi:outer membrane protein assembly factor BamB
MKKSVVALMSLLGLTAHLPAFAEPSVSFQINPAHDGTTRFDKRPALPMRKLWSMDFGMQVSYPVIADGVVYVLASKGGTRWRAEIHALAGADGAVQWSVSYPGISWMTHTYGVGRIFALDGAGTLRALDASTGQEQWSIAPGFVRFARTEPVFADGKVFAVVGDDLYALDPVSGEIIWSYHFLSRGWGAISVSGSAVYVSSGCNDFTKLAAETGKLLWDHDSPACDGGIGSVSPISKVGIHGVSDSPLILERKTGAQIGAYDASTTPALKGSRRFNLSRHQLVMVDEATGQQVWAFGGDGKLTTAPVVVNDVVFVGSLTGTLYAVDADTGTELWSTNVGSKITRGDSFAASDGLVTVSSTDSLTVFDAR